MPQTAAPDPEEQLVAAVLIDTATQARRLSSVSNEKCLPFASIKMQID